jgi:hypothetical protein
MMGAGTVEEVIRPLTFQVYAPMGYIVGLFVPVLAGMLMAALIQSLAVSLVVTVPRYIVRMLQIMHAPGITTPHMVG